MSIRELEPWLKVGPIGVGEKLGKVIRGDRGLGSIRILVDAPDDENNLYGTYHGYYVRVLDSDTAIFGQAKNIDTKKILAKDFVDQDGVPTLPVTFVLPGEILSKDSINEHPLARKIVRWIPN